MKVPFSWLKEFLQIDISAAKVAEILTMLGLEVDGIEKIEPSFSSVVVAEVIDVTPHPNADRLVVAQVSDGTATFQIVCGAPNCQKGLKTALAKEGAVLDRHAAPFKIKRAKMRGVESQGMLCSAKELGLSGEDEGIIALEEHWQLGEDLSLALSEEIFDISLTPNLGHALSVRGVARELAAKLDVALKPGDKNWLKGGDESGSASVSAPDFAPNLAVTVQASDLCPHYNSLLIEQVKVAPSPLWLQRKLELCGLKSINNIVDALNYCQQAFGQPLHAFDVNKLDNELVIRQSLPGETFTTLDGTSLTLDQGLLVAANSSKVQALAGIIGSQDSAVDSTTTSILLESAYFSPKAIRSASQKMKISSEASRRFERGVDPKQVKESLQMAAKLIVELAGGQIAWNQEIGSISFKERKVPCRLSRIEKVLGTFFERSQVENLLGRLGIEVEFEEGDLLLCSPPSWRHDMKLEVDIIEEIARLYGYDLLNKEPSAYHPSTLKDSFLFTFEQKVRQRLIAEGLQETYTCPLISPEMSAIIENEKIEALEPSALIRVLNPTSSEQSVMRPSLLPGMLQVVAHNSTQQMKDLSFFEVGRVYFDRHDRYEEDPVFAIMLTGLRQPYHFANPSQPFDFYDLKGILENLFNAFGVEVRYSNQGLLDFHPGVQASLYADDLKLGSAGEIHPQLLRSFGIEQKAFFAEVSLNDLAKKMAPWQTLQRWPTFPGSERDWTLPLPEKVTYDQVLAAIALEQSPLLEKVSLVSIYRHEELGKDMKNMTLRFFYRNRTRTLEQKEIDLAHQEVMERTKNTLNF